MRTRRCGRRRYVQPSGSRLGIQAVEMIAELTRGTRCARPPLPIPMSMASKLPSKAVKSETRISSDLSNMVLNFTESPYANHHRVDPYVGLNDSNLQSTWKRAPARREPFSIWWMRACCATSFARANCRRGQSRLVGHVLSAEEAGTSSLLLPARPWDGPLKRRALLCSATVL